MESNLNVKRTLRSETLGDLEIEPKFPFFSTELFKLLRTHSIHFWKSIGIFRKIFNFVQK